MDELSAIQRDLLVVLTGFDGPSGQLLKAELEEYYQTELNNSHLYSNLERLIEAGFVEKGEQDGRTNFYFPGEKC
ncbi:helix-turn-helix transcriptional regulator [Saliphagus infecundisoli]|uniref:Helix-turn-helix transcriptional regulator n=1 Tax=Saliphagus infecundisoli TaxID=1849069 RepID=A0ABD5QBI3_9EURY|nr:helix-turn-helix transcriptional regulator [Saliphagus infecundisoli]